MLTHRCQCYMPLCSSCCIHIDANPNVGTASLRDNALETTISIEKAIADLWQIIGNEVVVTVLVRLHNVTYIIVGNLSHVIPSSVH